MENATLLSITKQAGPSSGSAILLELAAIISQTTQVALVANEPQHRRLQPHSRILCLLLVQLEVFLFWEFHHLVPLAAANINAWTSGRPVLSYSVVVPLFILTFAAQALSVASLASSTANLLFGSHCDVAVSTMFSHRRRAALV